MVSSESGLEGLGNIKICRLKKIKSFFIQHHDTLKLHVKNNKANATIMILFHKVNIQTHQRKKLTLTFFFHMRVNVQTLPAIQ